MNIGVDVDGVLVDLEGYQLRNGTKYFSKKYGKAVADPAGYDIEQIFSCTQEEREKFWTKYIWGYCLTEPAIAHAAERIQNLKAMGHRIVIITGRAHTTETGITGKLFRWMLRYWLKKNGVVYDDIIFCSEKNSSDDKKRVCMEQQIDVMIDDKPENLLALRENIHVLCYPAIWNQSEENGEFTRVRDWDDVYEKIVGLRH